jgi:hypothetical protein
MDELAFWSVGRSYVCRLTQKCPRYQLFKRFIWEMQIHIKCLRKIAVGTELVRDAAK